MWLLLETFLSRFLKIVPNAHFYLCLHSSHVCACLYAYMKALNVREYILVINIHENQSLMLYVPTKSYRYRSIHSPGITVKTLADVYTCSQLLISYNTNNIQGDK